MVIILCRFPGILYHVNKKTNGEMKGGVFTMRTSSLMVGLTAGLAAGAAASMMAAGAMMNPGVRKKVNHTARRAENQMHQLAGKAEHQVHDMMNKFH